MGVRAAETMTTGSFSMSVSSMIQVKVESLLGDFDSPSPVGPLLGEREAVALVELARRIQPRERGEKDAAMPGTAAEIEGGTHEPLPEARAAVRLVDDKKAQPRGAGRAGAVDGDAADDLAALRGDPETVARRIQARDQRSQLVRHLSFKGGAETPVAGVMAAVQLDDAADGSRDILADLHGRPAPAQAVSENSSRPMSHLRIS